MIQIFYINKKYVPLYQLYNPPKKIPKNIVLDGEIQLFQQHINSRENIYCTHSVHNTSNYMGREGRGWTKGRKYSGNIKM